MNKYFYMKNLNLFVCLLFLLLTFSSRAQSGETFKVIYRVAINQKELPERSSNPSISSRWNNILKTIPSLRFSLVANRGGYKFGATENLESDFFGGQKSALIAVGGNDTFYGFDKERIVLKSFAGEVMNVEIETPYVWKITGERKEIMGYSCLKAVSDYVTFDKDEKELTVEVEAWFAPEINVMAGPFGFDNLPGLVLEATKDRKFTFKAISLKFLPESTEPWKDMPTDRKTISEQQYEDIIREQLRVIRGRG